ncbi:putative DnaC protein [Bacillus phage Gamma isolate d'Herelle]|uniref:DnaC protein n=4 Tax=Wbetavirus TaxID=1623308 RepID=Q2LIF0_9CAUD|nr:ATP-binding protein [Bacillus anthracis]YP_010739529.1 phage replication protein, putative [Bacillus phage Gamma]YP_338163.1 phage replication protein, putative [Bacillus phage Cherry]YP_338216.1 DnaC-like helicase loader [Bacillus phage Gamma]YP_459999.1 DnaC-like helicase loader [Bacillus phage WBeta]YP_512344.1 DnaC-like helicase loader [Bacillus phage Fah]ABC40486.1 putative DnaC protein [Bacillus phage Gamma isolate d'Herelle]EDX57897.1 phage protein [Bacillus cereus W]ABA42726.1 Dn
MKKIQDSFEKLTKLKFADEQCDKHTFNKHGKEVIKLVRKMIDDAGTVYCPRCMVEEQNSVLFQQANNHYKKINRERKKNVLFQHSIIENQSITESRLSTYKTDCQETKENKEKAIKILERIKNGEFLNVYIAGIQGVGKSHLAYAMLYELVKHYWVISDGEKLNDEHAFKNMKSCLFVEIEKLIRLIQHSFRNIESKYTMDYCISLMVDVDFLVIDDLGAESGSMNRNGEASDFVHKILYGVTNGRQGANKTTITTSNLSSAQLFQKYDPKLASRLLNGVSKDETIVFKTTTDKRIVNLDIGF